MSYFLFWNCTYVLKTAEDTVSADLEIWRKTYGQITAVIWEWKLFKLKLSHKSVLIVMSVWLQHHLAWQGYNLSSCPRPQSADTETLGAEWRAALWVAASPHTLSAVCVSLPMDTDVSAWSEWVMLNIMYVCVYAVCVCLSLCYFLLYNSPALFLPGSGCWRGQRLCGWCLTVRERLVSNRCHSLTHHSSCSLNKEVSLTALSNQDRELDPPVLVPT